MKNVLEKIIIIIKDILTPTDDEIIYVVDEIIYNDEIID